VNERRATLDRTGEQIRTAQADIAQLDVEIQVVTDSLTSELARPTVDAGTVGDLETQRDELKRNRDRLLARISALEDTLPDAQRAADEEALAEAIASYPAGVSAVNVAVTEWTDAAMDAGRLVELAAAIVERRKALREVRDKIAYLSELLGVEFPELADTAHVSSDAAAGLGRVFKLGTVVELDAYYVTSFEEKLRALHSRRRDEAAAERRAQEKAASEAAYRKHEDDG